MQTKTESTRTTGFLTLFDLQTTFFKRAIEGVSEADLHSRLNTKANHMAWLAGSAVQQRFLMCSETNPGLKQTGGELFSNHQGIQDEAIYPSAEIYLKDWERVSPAARHALVMIDDAKLDSEFDAMPMKMSYYDLISFTIYREANLIGQLALWRRLLNYPAIRYDG
ncbi:MAG TPA: DinB family protein [Anseongella sp.]